MLLALVPAPSAGAYHGEEIVLFEAVGPTDELVTFEFTPPPGMYFASILLDCNGASGYVAFRQSNVVGDPYAETACLGGEESSWDWTFLFHGATYSVTFHVSAPVRVVVFGDPYDFEWYNDHRLFHPFHWRIDWGGGIFALPALVGSFTPEVDVTDVMIASSGALVEVYEVSPEARLVGTTALYRHAPFPDLEAGASYVVHMTVAASCQPACFAQAEVDIRGVPAEAS